MTVLPDEGLAYTLAGVGRRKDPYADRRSFAQRLLAQGMDTSPVQSPWQGAARLAQAISGGLLSREADADEASAAKDRNTKLAEVMAEKDPQKKIGLLTAIDPEYGARLSGQMAVEQAKIDRQNQGLGQVASTYGGPGPVQAGPPTAGGVNPNNIGNVRPNGQSVGFQQPPTLDDGVRLAVNNGRAYPRAFNGGQPMTLVQIGQRWAPVGDGANDPAQWARNVANIGGLDPNQPIDLNDPMTAAKFARGVHGAEHGANKVLPVEAYARILSGGGAPQPGPQVAQAPPQVAQGTADTNGMPPVPSPQGVQGPTMMAPPQIPQRMTVRDMPPQMAAPFVERLRRGGYGTNPAEAETRMVADMQRALDVSFENQKIEFERNSRDYEYQRTRGDKNADRNQEKSDKAPQQQFDNSNKLRDEFNGSKVVQNYREVTPIMESMKEATQRPSRAADLNMVYALAKIMDPGSVVREGEMIMVNNTQGIGDRLAGMINSLNGGAQLTPETRQRIIEEAQSRYRGLEQSYKALEDHYGGMSDRFGLRREDVIVPIRKGARTETAPTSPEDLKKKYGLE